VVEVACLEVEIVRLEILGRHHELLAIARQADLERVDDRPCDLVLDGEYILELAIVRFRPEVIAVLDVDQFGGDADAIPDFTHASFQHRRHAELLADLANVYGLALEGKAGATGRNVQPGHLCQNVDDLFGHAIAEVLVLRVGAHVGEWQDRDRFRARRGLLCVGGRSQQSFVGVTGARQSVQEVRGGRKAIGGGS
jgi:hypothetical protein